MFTTFRAVRANPVPAVPGSRPRFVKCSAAEPEVESTTALPVSGDVGEKLREWLSSPFDLAAFGPRLTVGALLSAPERIQTFGSELERVSELMSSPAPPEDKSKLLASELEKITTEFLEKGAYVEADVIRQVKQLLPEDLAANIQEPETPASRVPEEYERPVAPISSSTTPVVTELPDDVELN